VVDTGNGAVVAELAADPLGQARVGHALLRELLLLLRQGDRVDPRAAAGDPGGELAPAGADLDQVGASGDAERVEQRIDLALLRLQQQLVSGQRDPADLLEQRGGIGHRGVEERLEQLIRQVVVPRDVALGVVDRAALVAGVALHVQVAQPLQPRGDELGHLRGEDG